MAQQTQETKNNETTEERPAVDTLDYEAAKEELTQTVRALEEGGLSLDDSLDLWERGEELAQRCESLLKGAHQRIEATLQKTEDEADDNASTDES
ncbi:MAG TPA: exodeoxyribonuclease VII small subunit [Corynebacteriales bacterium]|nr:exodeoxyribonuclease VII small subunit [Mycobacteriales bacterium]